jgi:hypothetical protein
MHKHEIEELKKHLTTICSYFRNDVDSQALLGLFKADQTAEQQLI